MTEKTDVITRLKDNEHFLTCELKDHDPSDNWICISMNATYDLLRLLVATRKLLESMKKETE